MIGRTNSATGGGGGEKYGNAYNVPETLPAPALTVISDTTGVSITWTAVPDAEGYLIFYGKSEEMPSSLKNYEHYEELAPTATSYRINISESFDTWYVGVFPVKEKYFSRDTTKEKSICTFDDYFINTDYAYDGLDKPIYDLRTLNPSGGVNGVAIMTDEIWVVQTVITGHLSMYYSVDKGRNWVLGGSKSEDGDISSACGGYLAKKNVFAMGNPYGVLCHSTNGKNWTITNAWVGPVIGGFGNWMQNYNEERLSCSYYVYGHFIKYSDDGINWVFVGVPSSIGAGLGVWNGTDFIWVSDSASNSASGYPKAPVGTMAHQNGTVISTNIGSILDLSVDKIWAFKYMKGIYFLYTSKGFLASRDASNWTFVCPAVGNFFVQFEFNKKHQVFVILENGFWVSKDGFNWKRLKNDNSKAYGRWLNCVTDYTN